MITIPRSWRRKDIRYTSSINNGSECSYQKNANDDHFNSVPARLVSVFPFNSWPVHQHVSQIEKTCYPRPEDKQVRVQIEQHPTGNTVEALLELQRR